MLGTKLRSELLLRGLSPKTARQYLYVIRAADAWFEGRGTSLAKASAEDVVDYLATKPRSHSTRKNIRSGFTHYWAIVHRRNPPLAVMRLPPKPKMVCRALDEDDARILAKAVRARGDNKGAAVALALWLGLRREEIATLRWSAFAVDGWCRVIGKGDVEATLPLHPVLVELLAELPHRSEYLFPGRMGGHCSPATIWQWSLSVADEAGVPRTPPHRVRHTCLATANDRTGDLRATQELARHADPATTSGYTRATAARLKAVVAALDY